jgi:hypothetical protein
MTDEFQPERFDASPLTAMTALDELRQELDWLSKKATEVERELEPVENTYQAYVDEFEIGLWTAYEDSEYKVKFPSEAMRLKLARKHMDPALLGRREGLLQARKRLEKRLDAVKRSIDAQRSILSALRSEAEATGSGFRRAAA